MQVRYVGNRAFKKRLAEITYSDQEEQKAIQLFQNMQDLGWDIDYCVQNYAYCYVSDKEEYIIFVKDLKECKKRLNVR